MVVHAISVGEQSTEQREGLQGTEDGVQQSNEQ